MGEPTKRGNRTALYVDDDPANRRLMTRLFNKHLQATLLVCDSGEAGLQLARNERPDLILLDLNIPDRSGDEVLAEMKSDPQLEHIPVVIISGDAFPQQVERLMAAGATSYVTKPFEISEMVALINDLLPGENGTSLPL